uniref:Retrovirus-related Pol polyprotein from transposon TNT 1-94-like beta-barrel domain-containing protein n=1 Tax=Fagus sylvatica TaxID=28930 RepID=A0A2N9GIT2_FAGSY
MNILETPPIIQSQNCDPCWYPDTGATSHMTADMPLLQQPQEYSGSDSVMVGNGAGLPISHTGNIYFHSFGSQFKLSHVLCVPAIKKNLLSMARFTTDNNCSFHFFPWGYRVQDLATGKVLLMGPIKDNLYPLPPFSATLRDQVGTFSKETAFLSSKTTPEIWHNRLGHPNFQTKSVFLVYRGPTGSVPWTAVSFVFSGAFEMVLIWAAMGDFLGLFSLVSSSSSLSSSLATAGAAADRFSVTEFAVDRWTTRRGPLGGVEDQLSSTFSGLWLMLRTPSRGRLKFDNQVGWAFLSSLDFGLGGWLLGHFSSCLVCRGSLMLLGFGPLVDHWGAGFGPP